MLTIYHNPRCSKSREALQLLQQQPQPFNVIEYLKTPLSAAQLQQLLHKLGISARQLLRSKEDEYQQLGLADITLSEQQLIAAMVAQPKLIERPIIENAERAVIGRPADTLLSLLS